MQEFFAGVGIAAVAATGWFGNFIGGFRQPGDAKAPSGMVATTTRTDAKKEVKREGVPAFSKANLSCIAKAADTREDALADAAATFGSAVANAYEARGDALASAYAKTDEGGVRAAVKAAWDGFKTTTKSARDVWNGTQRAAWKAFESSVKACGGSPVTDSANAAADAVVSPAI